MDMDRQPAKTRSRPPINRPACWWFLPVMLMAATAQGQTDSNALPALAPPYGEMPPGFWEQHDAVIIVGVLVLLSLELLYLRSRLRPAAPVVVPAEIEARQALSACSSRPEDGKLLSEVSRILRRYAAAAFAMPPGEVTTAEFCARLAANDMVGAELAGNLARFLRECDERKFAPVPAAAPLNAVARSLDLIALAETRRAAIARETEARKTPVAP